MGSLSLKSQLFVDINRLWKQRLVAFFTQSGGENLFFENEYFQSKILHVNHTNLHLSKFRIDRCDIHFLPQSRSAELYVAGPNRASGSRLHTPAQNS